MTVRPRIKRGAQRLSWCVKPKLQSQQKKRQELLWLSCVSPKFICWWPAPVPQDGAAFGSRILKEAVELKWGDSTPDPIRAVLFYKEKISTQTGKSLWAQRRRPSVNQRKGHNGNQPCWCLDFGLLASATVKLIAVAWATQTGNTWL